MNAKILILVCLTSTLFMTGLIWFVQVVHYPLFDRVDRGDFLRFHADHSRLTSLVVFVPMVLELLSSLGLLIERPIGVPVWLLWLGAALAGASWLSTALIQVPLHGRLGNGFDPTVHSLLVTTNWIRCVTWTGHSAVCLGIVARMFK